ncbi:hypothetical protein BC831DRAFT_453510 [Entophlyctis helioformis]|nr:hypothetical protein BC831DRAFT_453510 [Entophlyctis helioformis]
MLVPFDTPFERAVIVLYVPCSVGSVLCAAYCVRQLAKKQTPYMGWLLAANVWFLLSQAFIGIRCLMEPETTPFVFTRVSGPVSLSKLCYIMAEIEFLLLTSSAADISVLRHRTTAVVLLFTLACWVLRWTSDYDIWVTHSVALGYLDVSLTVLFFTTVDVVDIHIQARVANTIQRLLKTDNDRKHYLNLARLMLVLLASYNVISLSIYISSIVFRFRLQTRLAETLLFLAVTMATIHYTMSILLMETGRKCVLDARNPQRSKPRSGDRFFQLPPTPLSRSATVTGLQPTATSIASGSRYDGSEESFISPIPPQQTMISVTGSY